MAGHAAGRAVEHLACLSAAGKQLAKPLLQIVPLCLMVFDCQLPARQARNLIKMTAHHKQAQSGWSQSLLFVVLLS